MKVRRVLFLLFVFCSLFFITGCKYIDKISNTMLFRKVTKNMEEQTNYQMEIVYNLEVDREVMILKVIIDSDLNENGTGNIAFEVSYDNLKSEPFKLNSYMVIGENDVIIYRQVTRRKLWKKEVKTFEEFDDEELEDYNKAQVDYNEYEYLGTEKIEEEYDCEVYSFKVDISEILNNNFSNDTDIFTDTGLELEEFIECIKGIEYKVYIDKEDKVIRLINVDLLETLRYLYNENETMIIFYADLKIYYRDFGEVNVEIPKHVIEKTKD